MIYCLSHNTKTTHGYTDHLKISFFFDWSAQWWSAVYIQECIFIFFSMSKGIRLKKKKINTFFNPWKPKHKPKLTHLVH